MPDERAVVPCNGCTACCRNQRIMLDPDEDITQYHAVPTRRGVDGPTQYMLRHKPNGECFYLGDAGCTIHDRAPRACRTFDCRRWAKSFTTRQKRRILIDIDRDTLLAALDRMS